MQTCLGGDLLRKKELGNLPALKAGNRDKIFLKMHENILTDHITAPSFQSRSMSGIKLIFASTHFDANADAKVDAKKIRSYIKRQ